MKLDALVAKCRDGLIPPFLLGGFRFLVRESRVLFVRRRLAVHSKLHLACGNHVLNEWANIDLDSKGPVVGWNLTYPLPVRSGTIAFIFCEHFIEHIPSDYAKALLGECFRVLKPGGVMRLSTPNLHVLVDRYRSRDLTEWVDVGWNPVTPCEMLNEAFRLWGHQFLYDEDELRHILADAGFGDLKPVQWRESAFPELAGLECRPYHGELIFEATK